MRRSDRGWRPGPSPDCAVCGRVVCGGEQTAECRPRAITRKKSALTVIARISSGSPAPVSVTGRPPIRGHGVERARLGLPVEEVAGRHLVGLALRRRTDFEHSHEARAFRDRQGTQQDRADHAEYRRVQPDPERQRCQRDHREAGTPQEQAHCVCRVAPQHVEVLERRAPAEVERRSRPEPRHRDRSAGLGVEPLLAEVVGHARRRSRRGIRQGRGGGGPGRDARARKAVGMQAPQLSAISSFFTRALSTRSRRRSASASATFRPSGVSR